MFIPARSISSLTADVQLLWRIVRRRDNALGTWTNIAMFTKIKVNRPLQSANYLNHGTELRQIQIITCFD